MSTETHTRTIMAGLSELKPVNAARPAPSTPTGERGSRPDDARRTIGAANRAAADGTTAATRCAAYRS